MYTPCRPAIIASGHATNAGNPLAKTDSGASKVNVDNASVQASEGRQK